MAKSKSGGTRSYLRGRIANDVYSIGKDSKGAKQQVVRSLAEQVANPQTVSQMRGRMIMSTVMQAVSAMSQLIDHSFDGVLTGQPSISEFIRLNYALIKADVAANPVLDNSFGLNAYQEKGIKPGAWQISKGKNTFAASLSPKYQSNGYEVTIAKTAPTKADVIAAFGLSNGSYVTILTITNDSKFAFIRLHDNTEVADTTVVSTANIATCFNVENPLEANVTITFTTGESNSKVVAGVKATDAADDTIAVGAIRSSESNGAWIHTTSFMESVVGGSYNADTVLPSYPEGSQRFLNGGEL